MIHSRPPDSEASLFLAGTSPHQEDPNPVFDDGTALLEIKSRPMNRLLVAVFLRLSAPSSLIHT